MLETRLRGFGGNTGGSSGSGTAFAIPLIIGSGGTGTISTGSATMLVGMHSSNASFDYYNLLGSDNATVIRSGTGYFISAVTNAAGTGFSVPLIVTSGGTGRTTIGSAHTILGVNSSEASLTYYAILASNNAVVTKVGTSIFITANTATPIIYAATGNDYVVMNLAADLTNEFRLVQSGNSITVTTASGLVTINATTATPIVYSATGNTYIVTDFATDLTGEFRLVQSGNSITISTANNLIVINAVTGGGSGSGTVNTGSANYLAYYPSAGTTVDDVAISVSTGGGIAPFNVAILTSPAASLTSGDFWFQSSSNVVYLSFRSSNTTFSVAMAS